MNKKASFILFFTIFFLISITNSVNPDMKSYINSQGAATACNATISGCECCSLVSSTLKCFKCMNGTFLKNDQTACLSCANGCNHCAGPNPLDCALTKPGFFFDVKNNTIKPCPANCKDCHSPKCDKCIDGYFPSNFYFKTIGVSGCSVITITNCAVVNPFSSTKCEKCKKGFALITASNGARTCQTCSVSNCAHCAPESTSKCQLCLPGFGQKEDGSCEQLSSKASFDIKGQGINANQVKCEYGVLSPQKKCIKCSKGWSPIDILGELSCGRTHPCVKNKGPKGKEFFDCLMCLPGEKHQLGIVQLATGGIEKDAAGNVITSYTGVNVCSAPPAQNQQSCPPGCVACDPQKCLKCHHGYFMDLNTKSCKRCGANCMFCKAPNTCDKCHSGFLLDKGACTTKCTGSLECMGINQWKCIFSHAYNPATKTCVQTCPAGTFKSFKEGMTFYCASCTGPELNCATCGSGTTKTSSSITNEKGEQINAVICQSTGACHSSCQTCSGSSEKECLSCTAGLRFNPKLGTCTKDCQPGFFNKTVSSTIPYCYKCPEQCGTCKNEFECTSCPVGFFPEKGACAPCAPMCKKCLDKSRCVECETGYVSYFNRLKNVTFCGPKLCSKGFIPNKDMDAGLYGCVPCEKSCEVCPPGYFKHNSGCHKMCPFGTTPTASFTCNTVPLSAASIKISPELTTISPYKDIKFHCLFSTSWQNPSFTWTLKKVSDQSTVNQNQPSSYSAFLVLVQKLTPGQSYEVKVSMSYDYNGRQTQVKSLTFQVGEKKMTQGTFSVVPDAGTSLSTEFDASWSGFTTANDDVFYEVLVFLPSMSDQKKPEKVFFRAISSLPTGNFTFKLPPQLNTTVTLQCMLTISNMFMKHRVQRTITLTTDSSTTNTYLNSKNLGTYLDTFMNSNKYKITEKDKFSSGAKNIDAAAKSKMKEAINKLKNLTETGTSQKGAKMSMMKTFTQNKDLFDKDSFKDTVAMLEDFGNGDATDPTSAETAAEVGFNCMKMAKDILKNGTRSEKKTYIKKLKDGIRKAFKGIMSSLETEYTYKANGVSYKMKKLDISSNPNGAKVQGSLPSDSTYTEAPEANIPTEVFSGNTNLAAVLNQMDSNPYSDLDTNTTPDGPIVTIEVVDKTSGNATTVSNLATPVEIKIPKNETSSNGKNTFECKWFNESLGGYDVKGCSFKNQSSKNVYVESTHMTDFTIAGSTSGGGGGFAGILQLFSFAFIGSLLLILLLIH